ncbi:hypothetical protein P691DRAFT_780115 [Macrolepiota fuliginosa MF-IS2]|uniref:Uncharacterized protein n=1 Tax=Macrolepiota fuliginosa MF-IS2 TaxID=1400762 RepID=A0A9P5WZT4_9AGAR|nr:hypothetical protein P691DRAFT_780115 [Macrolepiota fuliginosa MF-IS2]
MAQPSILNVHTPTSSFAILHSVNQETLTTLFDKLSQKTYADYHGRRVGPGWLKYEYNGTIWNLDDESDYAIFSWRQQQYQFDSPSMPTNIPSIAIGEPGPSRLPVSSSVVEGKPSPTLHLHDPAQALPIPPAYRNPSYYAFHAAPTPKASPAPSSTGRSSRRSDHKKEKKEKNDDGTKLMRQFEKFHNENGVRTVMGSIGAVQNVRMLLKAGHRHVYVSRKFAQKHGFVPRDTAPGNYGYGGLINIGTWPITLVTSSSSSSRGADSGSAHSHHDDRDACLGKEGSLLKPPGKAGAISFGIGRRGQGHGHAHALGRRSPAPSQQSMSNPAPSTVARSSSKSSAFGASPLLNGADGQRAARYHYQDQQQNGGTTKPTVTYIEVYLSEEPHFDVVLGRSFFERRQIKTSSIDLTDVVCLDTGEKIECEVVILKDGKGEIVTVT